MKSFSRGRTSQQFRFLRLQFLQDGKLPFTNVLTVETITHALEKIDACWKDTTHLKFPTIIELILLNILDHSAHHVNPHIPLYH